MKTQMEYPLVGLIVLVVLVILWNIRSGMQVDLAVASLNATIAGTKAPASVMIAGQWIVKALVGTLLSSVVISGATALFVWVRVLPQKCGRAPVLVRCTQSRSRGNHFSRKDIVIS